MNQTFSALGGLNLAALKAEADMPQRNNPLPLKSSVQAQEFKRALENEQKTVKKNRTSRAEDIPTAKEKRSHEQRDAGKKLEANRAEYKAALRKNNSAESAKNDHAERAEESGQKNGNQTNDPIASAATAEAGDLINTEVNTEAVATVNAFFSSIDFSMDKLASSQNMALAPNAPMTDSLSASDLVLSGDDTSLAALVTASGSALLDGGIAANLFDEMATDTSGQLQAIALSSQIPADATALNALAQPLSASITSPLAESAPNALAGKMLPLTGFSAQAGVTRQGGLGEAIAGLQAFMDASSLADPASGVTPLVDSTETHGAMIKNQKSITGLPFFDNKFLDNKFTLLSGQTENQTDALAARLSERSETLLQKFSSFMPSAQTSNHSALATSPANTVLDARLQMPVNITFGQSGWGNMIAERSAMMASQNIKFAELQLDPPELGQLQVKVSINQETGQASVAFVSANPQVRDALEQSLVRLRDLMSEQGLNLVDVDVSDQKPEQQAHESGEHRGRKSTLGNEETEAEVELKQTSIPLAYGVDHFV